MSPEILAIIISAGSLFIGIVGSVSGIIVWLDRRWDRRFVGFKAEVDARFDKVDSEIKSIKETVQVIEVTVGKIEVRLGN